MGEQRLGDVGSMGFLGLAVTDKAEQNLVQYVPSESVEMCRDLGEPKFPVVHR